MNLNLNLNEIFCLETLEELGNYHKNLFLQLKIQLDKFESDKDIYDFINNYINKNNLSKAFPIGISINHVIAHDSYHESNIKKLNVGDFIKIDVGLIQNGNIIDSARTFVYKSNQLDKIPDAIADCEWIANEVEKYIRKQIEIFGLIPIQKISTIANATIAYKKYSTVDYLGGHTIEYNKVHGRHCILNKPIGKLPKEALELIDKDAIIGPEEMFAIEIYIGEKNIPGTMIKSSTIPTTHFQLNLNLNEIQTIKSKLNKSERETLDKLFEETQGLAYEYIVNKKYDSKIIKKLINSNAIIKHEPLEFKCSNPNEKNKYVQYEDCFLIRNNCLINLSK